MSLSAAEMAGIFQAIMPAKFIVTEPEIIEKNYHKNVTSLKRYIPLVLRPEHDEQVLQIVLAANKYKIPLYPFSTGKNWGLGSKLPIVDGCVLVDLAQMNRIIDVNAEFGYAIIEPGVTQAHLADHLIKHFPSLTMNFTGSFGYTSIVGNVLERGDGRYARVDDLLGVRGILGNGRPFQVGGLWSYVGSQKPSHHCRYFAGPDLTGMFSQSNFGIITQMVFHLIHQPERYCIFWGTAQDSNLESLVDTFDYFGRQGVINRGSVNIGYANRFVQAKGTFTVQENRIGNVNEVWNFYILISGTQRTASALLADLDEAFSPLCISHGSHCIGIDGDPYTKLPAFLHPFVSPLTGFSDTKSIALVYEMTSTPLPADLSTMDVDHTIFGMKACIPVIPPRGKYARQAAEIIASISAALGLNIKLSIFGDGRALITIHFRADHAEQVARAEKAEEALWGEMNRAGFLPYRVSINRMHDLVESQPEFFDTVLQLKSVLDPNNIISPGRYSPQF